MIDDVNPSRSSSCSALRIKNDILRGALRPSGEVLQAVGIIFNAIEGYIRHLTYKVQLMSGSSLTLMLNRTAKLNLTRFVLFSLKFFLYKFLNVESILNALQKI